MTNFTKFNHLQNSILFFYICIFALICLLCTLSPFCCQAQKLNDNRPKVHSALPLSAHQLPLGHPHPLAYPSLTLSLFCQKQLPAARNNNNRNKNHSDRNSGQQQKLCDARAEKSMIGWRWLVGVVIAAVVIIKPDK